MFCLGAVTEGMHLSAAIFVAASESQGEAYWRFHGFTTALRGLWLGSSSFPLLRSGCACFQEGSKKEVETCRRASRVSGYLREL